MAVNMAMVPVLNTGAATEHWNDASAAWTSYKVAWAGISSNYENVSLTPGVDETQLNLGWYSKTLEEPQVKLAKSADMKDAVTFKGTQVNINETVAGYYSNKVTVEGLKENTQYYYQVFKNGEWSETKEYKTGSFKNYSILYVGDPQIGACNGQNAAEDGASMQESGENLAARNDAFNWNNVLTQATSQHDVSFMVSAGDQVNTASKEEEYAGYLSAAPLASLPVATTIGNHDSGTAQYSYHYNNPNSFDKNDDADSAYTLGSTKAGTDYYYTYGDVLFIMIDTNNYNCATHENVIKKAIEENQDCKWRIVTFHQDIYGSGYDHSDSDGIVLRTQLTPLFDKYDIDVVLQGHDHTYSRTYQLTSDGQEHGTYTSSPVKASTPLDDPAKVAYLEDNNCYEFVKDDSNTVVNPEGTVYFEANSATGSKFYELIPVQQDYIAERSQTWTPSYSVINVSESAITVTTYDASTGAVLAGSDSYTIVKEADKTALESAIADAKAKLADAEKYTYETAKTLDEAVEAAEAVINNDKATEKEISEAAGAINEALTGLVIKKVEDTTTKVEETTTTKVEETTTATATTATKEQEATKQTVVAVPLRDGRIKSVKSVGAKKIKISWVKNAKVTGYQIKVATNKKFTKNVKTVNVKKASKTSTTVKKLKKSSVYYVKIRAYATVDGKKVYGAFGAVKKVETGK